MFQVEVKRQLVEYLFPRSRGWHVVVHLDPMEICRGGKHSAAKVAVARDCLSWFGENGVQLGIDEEYGKADLVARNASSSEVFVIEAEGSSNRQPDQALYSALGQTLLRKYRDPSPARFGLAFPAVPRWERQLSRIPRRLVQELGLHLFLVYPDHVRDLSRRWPSKLESEAWQIKEFLGIYKKLPHGVGLEVLEKRDKPDVFVREVRGERSFGIELTAVYLHDRSVPDMHMNEEYDWVNPACSDADLLAYEERLAEAVQAKVFSAQGYDLRYPLLLSVYVNEYISLYMTEGHWRRFCRKRQDVFSKIQPFSEIIFWNLPDDAVFCVSAQGDTYNTAAQADT